MSLRLRNGKKELRVHAVFLQKVLQHASAGTHTAGMEGQNPGPGQRDGLIEPFAACLYRAGQGGKRFPGLYEMIDAVYIVQIQRTKVQYPHADAFFLL